MKTNNYGIPEIIQNIKLVFQKKKVFIIFLFLIELVYTILLNIKYHDKLSDIIALDSIEKISFENFSNIFDAQFIIGVIISTILPFIIYGILASISYDVLFINKEKVSLPKRFIRYISMTLIYNVILIFIVFIYIILIVVFAFIPLLNILAFILLSIALIALIFYLSGYYRFVNYVAMTEGMDNAFSKSKSYIKGNFIISIILIILVAVVNEINSYFLSLYVSNLIIVSILSTITCLIIFILSFLDISLIFTGKKFVSENNNKEDT